MCHNLLTLLLRHLDCSSVLLYEQGCCSHSCSCFLEHMCRVSPLYTEEQSYWVIEFLFVPSLCLFYFPSQIIQGPYNTLPPLMLPLPPRNIFISPLSLKDIFTEFRIQDWQISFSPWIIPFRDAPLFLLELLPVLLVLFWRWYVFHPVTLCL